MTGEVDRLLQRGWRIQSATPTTVVLVKDRRPVNHAAHAISSVLTLGLWLPVWAIHAGLHRGPKRKVVHLTPAPQWPNEARW